MHILECRICYFIEVVLIRPFKTMIYSIFIGVYCVSAQPQPVSPNRDNLVRLATHYAQKAVLLKAHAQKFVQSRNMPVAGQSVRGRIFELQRIAYGVPVYYSTQNLIAARTISTDKVWPGMPGGFGLDGQDFTLGVWDAGRVYAQHQEYNGRVTQGDASPSHSAHATWVAGTLIAQGVVDSARGMAPAALLRAFDWNQDFAEMAAEAASGLPVSNHSYSYLTGWEYGDWGAGEGWYWFGDVNTSEAEAFQFGFYSDLARQADSIAVAAPCYLPVWAVGNDRNDGPSGAVQHWAWSSLLGSWVLSTTYRDNDGPYDCISGPGLAKNVLTVGAVNDIKNGYTGPQDVIMTSYSSWGPADDGRIKPDVVANGELLLTSGAGSPDAYVRAFGTSLAAPTVTGSCLLLQQHYYDLHSVFCRAATLKGLIVHTADEAGSDPGPDYVFGWGLMNTAAAARLISRDDSCHIFIHEKSFTGMPETLYLYARGQTPVKATLSWTDPPGEPPAAQPDPRTPMLVNDLDVRITRVAGGTIYRPYRLDPDHPGSAAATGDNSADNLEMIFIQNPDAGVYALTVDAKNPPAGGQQDYTLIMTGLEPASDAVLQVKTVLQGAAGQTGLMRTDLLAWVPDTSPYPEAQAFATIPNDVVDWVLLQLVNCENGHQYFKACLLKNDGDLLDPASLSPQIPVNIPAGYYDILIQHRNHITIQSADSVLFQGTAPVYDFTTGRDKYKSAGAAILLPNGLWGARSGDGNQSGGVYAQDYVLVRQTWQQSGYLHADYSMDGLVDDVDLNIYFNNQGREAR